jgi:hypothetical protein
MEDVARQYLSIQQTQEITARREQIQFDNQRKAYAEASENFYRLNPQIARARNEQLARDQASAELQRKINQLRASALVIDNAIKLGAISEVDGIEEKLSLTQQELDQYKQKLSLAQNLTTDEVNRSKVLQTSINDYNARLEVLAKAEEDRAKKAEEAQAIANMSAEETLANKRKIAMASANIALQDEVNANESIQAQKEVDEAYKKLEEGKEKRSAKDDARHKKELSNIDEMIMKVEEFHSFFTSSLRGISDLSQALSEQEMNRIDAETIAKIEAAGLQEETTIEKLEREREENDLSFEKKKETLQEDLSETQLSYDKKKEMLLANLEEAKMADDEKEVSAIEKTLVELDLEKQKKDAKIQRDLEEIALEKQKTDKAKAEEIARTKIIEDAEKAKAKIKYNADIFAWGSNLAIAVADAAKAIITGYAQLGPIGGSIAAVPTGIATAAQIAAINASKPQPPKLFTGSTNPLKAGEYIVGDQGPEMVRLPQGSQVLNNRDTMNEIGGRGQNVMTTIQVMIDSVLMAEKTVNVINNGLVRLEVR